MEFKLLFFSTIAFAVLFAIALARAAYWKGRCEEMVNGGGHNEAQFWRRHFDADSAESTSNTYG